MRVFLFWTMVCAVVGSVIANSSAPKNSSIRLAGDWRCRLDPDAIGQRQQWFSKPFQTHLSCQLPGTLDRNNIGIQDSAEVAFKIENLRRLTRKYEYTGPAWYQRTINIPKNWSSKEIILSLERVLWESTAWIDEHKLGSCDSLVTPHEYTLPDTIRPGQHLLTIRIDNSYKYNVSKIGGKYPMAHAYTNETQTIWNGIIGDISLTARNPVYISDIQIYPDLSDSSIHLELEISNTTQKAIKGTLDISCKEAQGKFQSAGTSLQIPFSGKQSAISVKTKYKMNPGFQTWDEFTPFLYDLTIQCSSNTDKNQVPDSETIRFGMREFAAEGTILKLNQRPIFLRGTLECCIFPRTGHPPMGVDQWLRIYKIARSYGLNHLRFHSWCPPKAAFIAADQTGFYLQVELPVWIDNMGKDDARDKFLREEGYRILNKYGNHPSFCLMSMGNELNGEYIFIHSLVKDFKQRDSRHLYTSTSFSFQGKHGRWPEPVDDFFVSQETLKGWIRGQGFFNDKKPSTSFDFRDSLVDMPVPVISHEIGQYTVFPNFKEIPKYGGPLKPNNLTAIQQEMKEKGLFRLADDYVNASGKWSVQLYKEDIEMAMRTPGMSGFQLLDLHDFPGQGTALIGILDAFWDSKGLIEPEQFRQFCNSTVPLARMDKRVFENEETFSAGIEVVHYGSQSLPRADVRWEILDEEGDVYADGVFPATSLNIGSRINCGKIEADLSSVRTAQKLVLRVYSRDSDFQNNWDFWVYPADIQNNESKEILVADFPDENVASALTDGKTVVLLAESSSLKNKEMGRFVPVFWSPVHFPNQINTMGLLCDPHHAAFNDFPTESFTSWQWWELLTQSAAVVMDPDSCQIKPIVRMIDGFTKNRSLYNLFEVKVDKGALLFCSIDLTTDLDRRIVARQLRHSLLQYVASDQFAPEQTVSFQFIRNLFRDSSIMLGAKVINFDSQQSGYEASRAIDGDLSTMWSTAWTPEKKPYPHEIQIKLKNQMNLSGFTYLPRQDGNKNGRVRIYEFYISKDGKDWGKPIVTGTFENNMQLKKVFFDNPNAVYGHKHRGQYIRFVATKGFGDDPYTTMAELSVLEE